MRLLGAAAWVDSALAIMVVDWPGQVLFSRSLGCDSESPERTTMRRSEDWIDDIRKLSSLVDQQEAICQQIAEWIWKNVPAPDVLPRELPVDIAGALLLLGESTRETKMATAALLERICATPAAKFMNGELLTREEFHLLASRGALPEFSRGPWGDPYDVRDVLLR
jgi:hypothetical protein